MKKCFVLSVLCCVAFSYAQVQETAEQKAACDIMVDMIKSLKKMTDRSQRDRFVIATQESFEDNKNGFYPRLLGELLLTVELSSFSGSSKNIILDNESPKKIAEFKEKVFKVANVLHVIPSDDTCLKRMQEEMAKED